MSAELHPRPKAILICYSLNPGVGSDAGAGWAWAAAASHVADVTVLAPPTWRVETDKAVAALATPLQVRWIELPAWVIALFRVKWVRAARYFVWQALAAKAVMQLEREEQIDVVHHITFSSDSLPTALLASHAQIRIWGPVGGSTRTAWGLLQYLTWSGRLDEVVRHAVTGVLRATFGRLAARHATLVIALNHDVEKRWRSVARRMVIESALALEPEDLVTAVPLTPRAHGSARMALFVARLAPWKGLLLAVEALSHAPHWRLVVLGDGPDRAPAERLARCLGVDSRLQFLGRVARPEVLSWFRSADALLFPSFHESAGWAAGEASALGCPVICLDVGGSALQAGRNAHVVPIRPTATLPRRIGERLEHLGPRGAPDDHLLGERIGPLLRKWYTAP